MIATMAQQRRTFTRIFIAVWLVWGLALAAIRLEHPGLAIGADWNDAHILVASEWYREHGHWGTLLIPPRQTLPGPDGTFNLYNTFPPGVFWLHELRRAVGMEALWAHRLAAIMWNQIAVLVLFLLVRRITASAIIAALSAGLYMLSASYATYSGGLWEHLPMLTMLGTLACWFEFERAPDRRRKGRWLAAAFALFVAENFLSVQHTVMVGVILLYRAVVLARRSAAPGRSLVQTWGPPMLAAASVLIAAPLVMVIRFAAQARVMGGFDAAVQYFTDKAGVRMGLTDTPEGELGPWGITASRFGVPGFPELPDSRTMQAWYPALSTSSLIGAAVLLLAAWLVRRAPAMAPARRGLVAGLTLLAGSLTWLLLFPQHTLIHTPVILMFMPGMAVLSGTLAALPVYINRAAAQTGQPRRAWAGPVLWAASLAVALPIVLSIRKSEAINLAVPVDDFIAERVKARADRERGNAAAAPLVKGVKSAFTMSHPITSHLLGVPFTRLQLDDLPERLDETEMVVLRLSEREGRRALATTSLKWGMPRFIAMPGDLVFYGPRFASPPGSAIDHSAREVAPNVSWNLTALEPTLDGRAWVACIRLEGMGSIGPYLKRNPKLRLSLREHEDAPATTVEVKLEDQAARIKGVLVGWIEIVWPADRNWHTAEVALVPEGGEAVTLRLTPGQRIPALPAATPK